MHKACFRQRPLLACKPESAGDISCLLCLLSTASHVMEVDAGLSMYACPWATVATCFVSPKALAPAAFSMHEAVAPEVINFLRFSKDEHALLNWVLTLLALLH